MFRVNSTVTSLLAFTTDVGLCGEIRATSGTTSQFVGSSDANLKIDRGEYVPGDFFDKVVIHNFDWKKPGDGDVASIGVFAQELHAIAPRLAFPGNDLDIDDPDFKPWMTPVNETMAMVFAELKALRARVLELEGAL